MTGIEKDYAAFQETHKHSAYEAYLKGWALYRKGTPEGFAGAIAHFEKAVEEDPAYGRALAALYGMPAMGFRVELGVESDDPVHASRGNSRLAADPLQNFLG